MGGLTSVTLREWTLILPMATPMSLNHRDNHWVRADKVKTVRDATHVLALQAKIPRCNKVAVTLIYTPRDGRRRDPLNLVPTLKACEDGLVDAKVVPDDTPQWLESRMPLIDAPDGSVGVARLVLLVEQMA